MFEKNENKQQEAGVGPFKERKIAMAPLEIFLATFIPMSGHTGGRSNSEKPSSPVSRSSSLCSLPRCRSRSRRRGG